MVCVCWGIYSAMCLFCPTIQNTVQGPQDMSHLLILWVVTLEYMYFIYRVLFLHLKNKIKLYLHKRLNLIYKMYLDTTTFKVMHQM